MGNKRDESNTRRTEQTFFDDGQIESEVTYVGEHIQGITRQWHENGTLKKEVPMTKSRIHGVVRQWSSDGSLLDESEFTNGTGLHRTWFDKGCLKTEGFVQNGIPVGRLRSWDEDGELIVEKYYLNGKAVSRKRYEKAAQDDTLLPRYDDDGQITWADKNKELIDAEQNNELAPIDYERDQSVRDSLVSNGKHAEALAWLKENTSDENDRFLGEGMSNADSIELIEQLYSAGAKQVLAVEIEVDPDGCENTSKLIVELDQKSTNRKRVFDICNPIAIEAGYSPAGDMGQEYLFVKFD